MMRVFLSSTRLDLEEHRKAVRGKLSALDVQVIAMEEFPPGERDPLTYCREQVKGSDLFVLVLRARYGHRPDGKTSMTNFEYLAAGEEHIERCVFECDESTIQVSEIDVEDWALLKDWEKQLRSVHVVATYKTPEELALRVEEVVRKKREQSPKPRWFQGLQPHGVPKPRGVRKRQGHRGLATGRIDSGLAPLQ
jgi:hypothetical protein